MRGRRQLVGLAAALLASWLPIRAPLRDAVTSRPVTDVELVVPVAYTVCSPLCRVTDAVAMLSVAQLTSLLLTAGVLLAAWYRWPRARKTWPARHPRRAGVVVFGAFALGASVAVLPYPMVWLSTRDRDELRVDFHSHTASSHDARPGFDVAARRAWHAAAGFDVAYVSDHRVFDAAEEALAGNPRRAGDGTVLLPAYEGRYLGSFMVFLGLRRADTGLVDRRRHLRDGYTRAGRLPISVAVPPGLLLRDVTARARDSLPRVRALQIWDGSPVASWHGQRDRTALLDRASALGIPVVSGSNHHGWGRTAAAWTLVRLPGWQSLSPDSLGGALEAVLRAGARDRVRVIERVRPDPRESRVALALTLPAVVWNVLRSLTPAERVSWMAWGVVMLGLARWIAPARPGEGAAPRSGPGRRRTLAGGAS